jgi:dynein heavy chain
MVTEDGLEDQLLAKVVLLERPDLALQKDELIAQQNNFKIKLTELEDGILEQLANAEGDVTENIALIENLEDSKATSLEVADKMIIAKKTEVVIEEARERYRNVANRGSLMFFLLSDLFKVHTFHFYSLNSFTLVYQRAIVGRQKPGDDWSEGAAFNKVVPACKVDKVKAAAEAAKEAAGEDEGGGNKVNEAELKERLEYLTDNITYEVFNYARRGLFEKHKLIVATMLVIRVMSRKNDAPPEQIEYLITGKRMVGAPNMTAKVQDCLTYDQWSAVCALKDIEPFKTLHEDMELYVDSWKEWIEDPAPEKADLPGDWAKKCTPFSKMLLVRALRQDRMTAALGEFITEYLGARFMIQPVFDLEDTFIDSSFQTPLFFVLFPGVDPGDAIESLGNKLGFTEANGNYVSISMGQGQEKNGENVLDRFTREGGWAFLQNVHLMQGWLPMLERKLEIAQEIGHEDFRCFVTAEPPGLPTQMLIPEGIMQASIKCANEPPTDVKSLFRSAYALFSQEDMDKSTRKVAHGPMLFALSFFHAIALGRRKFGKQGFSRSYEWNNGDLKVCGAILHNYLESNEDTPWADVRYLFGEVMYGGHITDPWDRRITSCYLDILLCPDLIDEKTDFEMCKGLKPMLEGNYKDYQNYIENESPNETPIQFGMHPNAEISLLNALCENLFFSILSIGGGGGGGGGGQTKEEKVSDLQVEIIEALRDDFVLLEIRNRIKDKGAPYVVFVLGEIERMNKILSLMRTQLNELALGLSGALNISDSMDALITAMFMNQVPPIWLKTCGQIGPTGTYNRKTLSSWYEDLKLRWKQLEVWSDQSTDLKPMTGKPVEALPASVWIAGCFNPMGFVTATLQVTSRAKKLSLDQMRVHIEVSRVMDTSEVEVQPDDGAHIHGFFMENSRWDMDAPGCKDSLELEGTVAVDEINSAHGSVVDSRPKELYPVMPMLILTGRTVENAVPEDRVTAGRFVCPFYTTTVRGPTFVFAGGLRCNIDPKKWIIAGSCLVMQPD